MVAQILTQIKSKQVDKTFTYKISIIIEAPARFLLPGFHTFMFHSQIQGVRLESANQTTIFA